jgi:hypothetical protein
MEGRVLMIRVYHRAQSGRDGAPSNSGASSEC